MQAEEKYMYKGMTTENKEGWRKRIKQLKFFTSEFLNTYFISRIKGVSFYDEQYNFSGYFKNSHET